MADTDTFGGVRRSATDPSRPRTSGSDVPLTPIHDTVEHSQRVRFSLDTDSRPHSRGNKKTKSDDLSTSVRDRTPNLSVDTTLAMSARTVPTGDALVSPSRTVTSPTQTSQSPSFRAKLSPMSPAGRQRGYSLRSALLQRNMREQPTEASDAVIEMTDVGSSSQSGQSRPLSRHSTHPNTGKKSMDTVVEISPVVDRESDDDLKLPYHHSRPGVHGIAALPNYNFWIQSRTARNPAWRSIKQSYSRARKFILRIQEIPPSKDGRHIDLDISNKKALLDERTGKNYILNTIRSSRYNAWNFVPRQLFAQFSKLANFYFLCVSILQMIPGLSTTGSMYTATLLITG